MIDPILGKINWSIRLPCQISVSSTPILFFYYKQRSAEMTRCQESPWGWTVKICAFHPQTAWLKGTNPLTWMFRGYNTHQFWMLHVTNDGQNPLCILWIKEILHFVQLEKIRGTFKGSLREIQWEPWIMQAWANRNNEGTLEIKEAIRKH